MYLHANPSPMSFTPVFFRCLRMHFIMVDDYPYEGVDFQGDPELMFPKGEKWGVIGKIS